MNTEIWSEFTNYLFSMGGLELAGTIFAILCVLFLIYENILTWICGILYVLISFVIFWNARLYGDFILHIFFLVLNIYGWYHWVRGVKSDKLKLPVTTMSFQSLLWTLILTAAGTFLFARFLIFLPNIIEGLEPASLPYWDSTTSVLSVTGMWLTARKKIENWYFWFAVDVLATGIYFHKDLYFYSILYFIYIGLAVFGWLKWKNSINQEPL